ncbi:MAG: exopolyphosphatase [Ignavibacteriae bacterium]|nr:MAG: exopolyphosphatase [Ignavibacteriota bacterium]
MKQKLAAIDIGTNSFHLIVVGIDELGHYEVVDNEKEVIRLSEGSSGDIKIIQEVAIQRAINALKKFVGIAESYNAEITAVATSAVREAENKIDFLKRVYHETGIHVEVISGIEEGRLIYQGVKQSVPTNNKKVLCIDIGGGSTEFVIGQDNKIIYANSLKLGAVRLTKKYFPDYIITQERIEKCEKWVEGVLYPLIDLVKKNNVELFIGSSGTIMAAGQMIKYLYDKDNSGSILNNYVFTFEELKKIKTKILAGKKPKDRKKIKGLDEKRADIIPAGIILLSKIFESLQINEMIISDYALREGLIFETINKKTNISLQKQNDDIRSTSVLKLARSCNYDLAHCLNVAKIAEALFEQLSELHLLPSEYREYLNAAATLHDIGYHIAHSKHHKHSQYIIVNSELMGFNENEIRTIACVARYHRKSHPKKSHEEYMLLPKEWRVVVQKLSAILRVADALDRTHKNLVDKIVVKHNEKEVQFFVNSSLQELEIELWSLNRRKALFEEIFNKKITVYNLAHD